MFLHMCYSYGPLNGLVGMLLVTSNQIWDALNKDGGNYCSYPRQADVVMSSLYFCIRISWLQAYLLHLIHPTNETVWPLERIGMMFLVTSNQIRDALHKDGNGRFDFSIVKIPQPSSYPRQAEDVMLLLYLCMQRYHLQAYLLHLDHPTNAILWPLQWIGMMLPSHI